MSVGLLRLSCDESFDPLSDLGNVFWFLEALRMSLPGFGELPSEQMDHVLGKMWSRISVYTGGRMAGPGQCGLPRQIPLTLQQRCFTLRLVIGHRDRSHGLKGDILAPSWGYDRYQLN